MLKILFSLLICVLGHCSNLDNVIKENLSEEGKVVSPISPESVPVTPAVNTPSKEPILYREAYPVNIYNFPEYNEDVILSKMQDSLLYVLVPVHDSGSYIGELVKSINKAAKELPSGCIVYPIFRIDDDPGEYNDTKALRKAIKKAHVLTKNYDISKNTENKGLDFTRRALLDKMIEINNKNYKDENRNTYFVFLDSDDVINKSTFKVFLSTALLHEDKWMFDFEHCIRCFNEDNKSKVVLDTNLSPTDFCYTYYDKEVQSCLVGVNHYTNFDQYGFLAADRFNNVLGYCLVLYKYDEARVKSCKNALTDDSLEHFSPAYADRKNLNQLGTTTDYKRPEDDVISAGYFKVFPKGFDLLCSKGLSEDGKKLAADVVEKKGALYYYRRYDRICTAGNAIRRFLKFFQRWF